VYPYEGADAFSLFTVAIERLCARLLSRGAWDPTATLGSHSPGRSSVSVY
jgi:hypothetical protein